MHKFTIDFIGLLNSADMTFRQLAIKAGLNRDAVYKIGMGRPQRYNRVYVSKMLTVLNVKPTYPLFIDEETGRFSVDWTGKSLNIRGEDVKWLVKKTRLPYANIYHMIFRIDGDLSDVSYTYYDRITLGTVLNVLGVEMYPPFYIETTSEPRGPHGPQRASDYHRSRST